MLLAKANRNRRVKERARPLRVRGSPEREKEKEKERKEKAKGKKEKGGRRHLTLRELLLRPALEKVMHRLEMRRLVRVMVRRLVKVARLAKDPNKDQAKARKVALMVSLSRQLSIR